MLTASCLLGLMVSMTSGLQAATGAARLRQEHQNLERAQDRLRRSQEGLDKARKAMADADSARLTTTNQFLKAHLAAAQERSKRLGLPAAVAAREADAEEARQLRRDSRR